MLETTEYKTPIYMRKSYKTYYDKNRDSEEFKEKRRIAQRKYYEKNKEKVLLKLKEKRDQKKLQQEAEEVE